MSSRSTHEKVLSSGKMHRNATRKTAVNRGALAGLLCLLCAMTPALAHHSFATFDATKHATVEGTVKELQWSNPHSWLLLLVPTGDGKTTEYIIEGNSPNVLLRLGWTKNTLKAGDKVKVGIVPQRNGGPGGWLESVVLSDGRTLRADK